MYKNWNSIKICFGRDATLLKNLMRRTLRHSRGKVSHWWVLASILSKAHDQNQKINMCLVEQFYIPRVAMEISMHIIDSKGYPLFYPLL